MAPDKHISLPSIFYALSCLEVALNKYTFYLKIQEK